MFFMTEHILNNVDKYIIYLHRHFYIFPLPTNQLLVIITHYSLLKQ